MCILSFGRFSYCILKLHCALLVARFEGVFCLLRCSCSVLSIVKVDFINFISMPRLCESLKHQALVQLRSGVSTRKVAYSLGMSRSSIAHMRREINGETEKQRGGRSKVLGERGKRLGVHLVTASTGGTLHYTLCEHVR